MVRKFIMIGLILMVSMTLLSASTTSVSGWLWCNTPTPPGFVCTTRLNDIGLELRFYNIRGQVIKVEETKSEGFGSFYVSSSTPSDARFARIYRGGQYRDVGLNTHTSNVIFRIPCTGKRLIPPSEVDPPCDGPPGRW